MTQTIPASDHGRVYLYALPEGPDPDVAALLGVKVLDLAHVDVIRTGDLEGYGLRNYLTEGMGISGDEIGPEVASLTGTLALLRSAAFGGKRVDVTPAPGVRHIATYGERQGAPATGTLESAAAELPGKTAPAPSNAKVLGRVAMIALAVIFALTALMIWIA